MTPSLPLPPPSGLLCLIALLREPEVRRLDKAAWAELGAMQRRYEQDFKAPTEASR